MSPSNVISMSLYSLSRHIAKPLVRYSNTASSELLLLGHMFYRLIRDMIFFKLKTLRRLLLNRSYKARSHILSHNQWSQNINRKIRKGKKVLKIIVSNVRAWRCGDIPCYVSPNWCWVKIWRWKYILKLGFIRKLDMPLSSDISMRIYSLSRHIAKPLVRRSPI